jgi:hypothetical protein
MKSKFFVITAVTFTLTSACPAAADTDASILNETFFDIGGPPSDYAYNNQDQGNWSVTQDAAGFEYMYVGQPFTTNLIEDSTNISVDFFSSSLLKPSMVYNVSSPIFEDMTISDGIDTIIAGEGTFLSSSYIRTDRFGNVNGWIIVELIGADRTFTLGDVCCTIGDPPVLYTYKDSSSSSVPEPSTWTMMLIGFGGLGLAGYRRAKALGPLSASSAD